MNDRSQLFRGISSRGGPRKSSYELRARILELTLTNRRITNKEIALIVSAEFWTVSREFVRHVRLDLGFKYEPPIHTFLLTPLQKANRYQWVRHEIAREPPRDWGQVLFTDESYVWLGDDHRWLWRRRGETGPDVEVATPKFRKKILIFGGISLRYKTKLILIEQGTVDGAVYVDDCIDASGLILDMDTEYGKWNWTLMQDGASAHTAEPTLAYLRLFCNILEPWPSGSPDLNPIENLWAIMKRRISEVGAQTIDELRIIINAVWDSVTADEVAALINSMPTRLLATARAQGGRNGY
jgi:hypothetical protein